MTRSRVLVSSSLASICIACASGPTITTAPGGTGARSHAPTATSGEITAADLMTRLYIFADDSMLGRESGQLGNVRGTDYVAREMRRMGLQPAGENGTYFQTVPLQNVTVDARSSFVVEGARLSLWTDVAPQLSAATRRTLDGSLPVIFGGRIGGVLASPSQSAGKLVVFLPAAPIAGERGAALPFSGSTTTARTQQQALVPFGRTAAAIAYITLDSVSPTALGRLRQPRLEIAAAPVGAATAPVLLITAATARRIFGGVAVESLPPAAAGYTINAQLAVANTPVAFPARNVVGVLPGSDASLRGQYVAVGAHNDHIGLTARPLDHDSVLANNMVVRRQGVQDTVRSPTPDERVRIAQLRDSLTRAHGGARADSVNNGADDDGSGTVAMLEIAERFATAQVRPRRSLIFVSHTGEEKGLLGSQWFTDHPTVSRDSIVAQLNMDMVGRGKPGDIMGRGPNNIQLIGPRRLSTQLGALIDSLNASRTPHMDIDTSFDANGHPLNRYCRSDHYEYARYGIPITYFSLGYHTDYHQVTDEPQYIDYDHMQRTATFVHDIADAVANRPQRLVVDGPRLDPQGGCRQ